MANLIDIVKKGSTDRSVTIRIIDSTDGTPETGVVYNTSGIDLWYRREGATKTSITEADLATPALDDAHADGGFLHIGDGEYRLDLPDAAFATGANHVDIGGTVTGMVVIGGRVRLVDWDVEDSDGTSLTEAGGDGDHLTEAGGTGDQLTALSTFDASTDGVTLADGAHGGGSTTITLQTPVEANATQISGDSTAADNAEAMFDGTGYAGGTIKLGVDAVAISGDTTAADNLESDYDGTGYDKTASSVGAIRVNTAQAGAAGTITLDASASATNDLYNGALITIRSGTGAGQSRWIYDYVGSTKVASVSRDWTTNPSSDSVFVILPSSHPLIDDIADLDDYTASAAYKLSLITSGTSINITSTITDGDVFTILQGETRDFTDGNHIKIEVDGTVTDLTGYTPKFAFTKLTSNSGTTSLELSGTVVNAGLATQYIYFEMTEAQTEALALDTASTHPYRTSSNYAYRWDASSTDGVSNCPGHGTGYVSVKAMATTC